ncbi:uncharacterized protein MELLADRAFT_113886 [Melampsora larici-populina 98AG31]|uniref:Conserved oligomeric Golgi complex subunit 8 n=1 Tax=Melampsora larici-populina (strain 98AG31 / pathotype 3-4-7) TaxID=747676 RepID=F4SBC9_MELLP|nr:uncharacterized protein MELLADRAFT_113886 [Melampsora larici-populina 98AG31]EGF98053.1 hypothetical protein MELLADRAFT_113886 [Melampsora larici-populina 98AG31]
MGQFGVANLHVPKKYASKKHRSRANTPNHTALDCHPSAGGVLHQIRLEVDRALQALRDNLINSLKDRGLKFPSAVRTIGVLRRMSNLFSQSIDSPSIESLTKPELRITFLASRWSCLANALQQVQLSTGFSPSALSSTSNPLHLDQFSDASLQYTMKIV